MNGHVELWESKSQAHSDRNTRVDRLVKSKSGAIIIIIIITVLIYLTTKFYTSKKFDSKWSGHTFRPPFWDWQFARRGEKTLDYPCHWPVLIQSQSTLAKFLNRIRTSSGSNRQLGQAFAPKSVVATYARYVPVSKPSVPVDPLSYIHMTD